MPHKKLQAAIRNYAAAYGELEELQKTLAWMPRGDQKTGSIGEHYAYLYLTSKYDSSSLSYGRPSEKGWDIEVNSGERLRVQVKTVSAYSKTRTISPIHSGWDELFIIFLDRAFWPQGFWIVGDKGTFGEYTKLAGLKCCDPTKKGTGSACIPFGRNLVSYLHGAIDRALAEAEGVYA